ncbi:MAG: COG4315 family predicted lipoprotein [Acidimicrobiales bacterium]
MSGKATRVLADTQGRTLYYFTPDTSTTPVCTSTYKLPNGAICTTAWPPLVLAVGTPGSSGALPGKLSVASGGNGRQVTYQGHPLYTFAGDTGPGQANGEGLLGKWYVATPNLSANSASTATSGSSSGSSYGGGY